MALAQFDDCYERYATSSDDSFEPMWYACIPHSEPKVIRGSWALDFEWNAFFENKEPTPREAFPKDYLPPNLAFKTGVERPDGRDGKVRLWRVTFMGREQTCNLFPEIPPTFFVERIIDKELVWEVGGYPDYTLE
ncbi:hypothetical protein K3152_11715 [Qipengyuania sp. 1NDH17]|uniref:Uncharacterized protein n=1 Tax=Qipengyuania polymorpha TaxID=2867234 RepID=A0ABS7IZB5_9SPHN|nr:hypothetical protein [Qipengyuania polymorpha]MBX7458915.1 hypothetical protein [Qipengyuania polymorpha]